jgi:hypothetical protein
MEASRYVVEDSATVHLQVQCMYTSYVRYVCRYCTVGRTKYRHRLSLYKKKILNHSTVNYFRAKDTCVSINKCCWDIFKRISGSM